jgi:hypothetical protein
MRDAGEVVQEAAMGIRLGATIDDFVALLHVYSPRAEVLKMVAISRYKVLPPVKAGRFTST